MSAKNLSIDQNWCRVLLDSLIWKIQCRFGYFDTKKSGFDLNIILLFFIAFAKMPSCAWRCLCGGGVIQRFSFEGSGEVTSP